MEYEYVVKQYSQTFLLQGQPVPEMMTEGLNGMASQGWEPIFVNMAGAMAGWVTYRRAKQPYSPTA